MVLGVDYLFFSVESTGNGQVVSVTGVFDTVVEYRVVEPRFTRFKVISSKWMKAEQLVSNVMVVGFGIPGIILILVLNKPIQVVWVIDRRKIIVWQELGMFLIQLIVVDSHTKRFLAFFLKAPRCLKKLDES